VAVCSVAKGGDRDTERRSFPTSTVDDHKPLKLHFGKLAEAQTSIAFRI
jgi:hypothetical protein